MNTLPPSQVQVYAQLWTLADEDKDGQVGKRFINVFTDAQDKTML